MTRQLDVLFVNPRSSTEVYQELAKRFTAIEVPVWSLLLAKSVQSIGFGAEILDCEAEHLSDIDAVMRIYYSNPRLIVFVVYGGNPNAGSANMVGAVRLAAKLRKAYPHFKIAFIGSHTSALPREVLAYDFVDFVFYNEGVYGLQELLATDLENGLTSVNSLGFKQDGVPQLNTKASVVPSDRMDIDLPGYAWELLPYKNKRFDLYRSHNWHANFIESTRSPAAAIYTSLSCPYQCEFCVINIVSRTNSSEGTTSAQSNTMRFWSPSFVLKQLEQLAKYGISTLRFDDEMFYLNKNYYEPLLKGIIEQGLKFNIWAYTRINSVKKEFLELFKNAGVNWLAAGIESSSQTIRKEVTKGYFKDVDIRNVVKEIQDHGISVVGNFIYGLTGDKHETMQETLDLALELCTEHYNAYGAMALPGSPLYYLAKNKGYPLPASFEGWSFHSYECVPLPTDYLTAAEVLKFRDEAWQKYFTYEPYLALIERKFGAEARKNIGEMAKIKLRRKLLGD
jgi:radical SAM superfamily enzyme YgiQ (UPF0313 family)